MRVFHIINIISLQRKVMYFQVFLRKKKKDIKHK